MKHTCEWCGYTGKDTEFLDTCCPACCRDNITGEKVPGAIPTVFHEPEIEQALAAMEEDKR